MPKHFLALCLCIVTAYGCQSTSQNLPQQTADTRAAQSPQTRASTNADSALSQRYTDAQAKRDQALLKKTKLAIDRGDTATAQGLISNFVAPPEEAALGDTYLRLLAQIQARLGQPELAAQSLLMLRSMGVRDIATIRDVCAQIEATACVIQTLVVQQLLATDTDSISDQSQIWATLQRSSALPQHFDPSNVEPSVRLLMTRVSQISQIPNAEQQVANIRLKWFALHDAIRRAGTPREAQDLWRNWRDTNPDHPASITPPKPLRLLAQYDAPSITVMLPLSGRLASVGEAVRDGMVAGYLADQASTETVASLIASSVATSDVTFFDSHALGDAALLSQVANADSDVIVGPLLKERGQRLLSASPMPSLAMTQERPSPSWIVLNRIEESGQTQPSPVSGVVYQFAPAIEDEALTLAKHLRARGHDRLMVVVNRESWAYRAIQALKSQWQGVMVFADFDRPREITGTIGTAMGVAASQQRHSELQRLLSEEIEFLPRGREDLDAVVAFTSALEAKALVPALQFHFADELPVFATSQSARSGRLSDIAGFHVTELPLLTDPDPVAAGMTAAFDLREQPLLELFALGLDAYRLATWVHWIQTHKEHFDEQFRLRLNMASGELTLGREGLVARELTMAEISSRGTLMLSQDTGSSLTETN
mgnify:FL=1